MSHALHPVHLNEHGFLLLSEFQKRVLQLKQQKKVTTKLKEREIQKDKRPPPSKERMLAKSNNK